MTDFPTDQQIEEAARQRAEDAAAIAAGPPAEEQTFEGVFFKWFRRFNEHEEGAKAVPHPGYVSLERAVQAIVATDPTTSYRDALAIVEQVECVTRHMHAQPTRLSTFWLAAHDVDPEHWRVKASGHPDSPQHWFAVQVASDELQQMLVGVKQRRRKQLDASAEAEQHLPPGTFEQSCRDEAERKPDFGPFGPFGPPLPTVADLGDVELAAIEAAMPPHYMLHVTPDGFVARWQTHPKKTATEALQEAWSHHAVAEVLRGK